MATRLPAHEPEPGRPARIVADWIGDEPPSRGLRLYLDALRSRFKLVLAIVALTVASAAFLVAQTPRVYQAEADLLITPIPDNRESFFGLGLVTESGDPVRDAETLAQLITTLQVAERARVRLGVERSAASLLKDVSAEPVAQSSIVTITARANDPEFAARLANTFADAAVAVRTERLHALLDSVIPRLRRQIEGLPPGEVRSRDELAGRLRDLETVRLLPDPTLHIETRASPPASPVTPRPVLTIAAALIAGLILGSGVILGVHMLDARVEREEDLRQYRIPILGRIPRGRRRPAPLRPDAASSDTRNAVQRLANTLEARIPPGARSIFLTGAGRAEGRTTAAVDLAAALGSSNGELILIEGDWRRPALAETLGLNPAHGLTDVLSGRVALDDALVEADGFPGVRVLPREPGGDPIARPVSGEDADALIRETRARTNWMIFDGPPLTHAPDWLPIVNRVATVVLVVRLGRTRTRDLAELAGLLQENGITPEGFVLVGGRTPHTY